jgi:O-antigen/teichoic acid export membrane protein
MTVVGVIAALLISPAIHIMYDSAFLPLVLPFLILIPGVILSCAVTPITQYFMSINRAKLCITLPVLPLALQIGLAMILIPVWAPEVPLSRSLQPYFHSISSASGCSYESQFAPLG